MVTNPTELAKNLIQIQYALKDAQAEAERQSDLVEAKRSDLADAETRSNNLSARVDLLQQAYDQAEADLRAWAREDTNESV